jgi:Uma2 family endonuclease
MASVTDVFRPPTLADLIDDLGGISPSRILRHPAPGTATEEDVRNFVERKVSLCELVDGVLVEKAMGFRESILALALVEILKPFVRQHNLGLVSGEAGLVRLAPGLVRGPGVAFFSWVRIPGGCVPNQPIPDLAPDLAIEVLSESNTPAEMDRKRREYFAAGAAQVWQIDPEARSIEVFTSPAESTLLQESQTLEGGNVLPGFSLPLARLFAELDQKAQ